MVFDPKETIDELLCDLSGYIELAKRRILNDYEGSNVTTREVLACISEAEENIMKLKQSIDDVWERMDDLLLKQQKPRKRRED